MKGEKKVDAREGGEGEEERIGIIKQHTMIVEDAAPPKEVGM